MTTPAPPTTPEPLPETLLGEDPADKESVNRTFGDSILDYTDDLPGLKVNATVEILEVSCCISETDRDVLEVEGECHITHGLRISPT